MQRETFGETYVNADDRGARVHVPFSECTHVEPCRHDLFDIDNVGTEGALRGHRRDPRNASTRRKLSRCMRVESNEQRMQILTP